MSGGAKPADDVPETKGWISTMDADKRGEENGEKFDNTTSEAERESRYSVASCRVGVPGAAVGSDARALHICSFVTRQVSCGVLNQPEKEARSTGCANKCQMETSRDGRKSYPCKFYMKGCCAKGEQCRFDHPGDPETAPACRDFRNGKCKLLSRNCKYLHISSKEYDKEEAERKKNRDGNH